VKRRRQAGIENAVRICPLADNDVHAITHVTTAYGENLFANSIETCRELFKNQRFSFGDIAAREQHRRPASRHKVIAQCSHVRRHSRELGKAARSTAPRM
jgi:hypothetical protein